ncbi:hypothetical protein LTR36_005970 [Oleoguttula mirabilis]|uniref:BTB domain-containing protein n=1 Tax=Oleoguttula mirabilis TaxID=1507867 RepID=A0AAV9JDD6_9PEZI|nr:hypothetical protein LTR36_005970 [Oleoguttula mirabilis]
MSAAQAFYDTLHGPQVTVMVGNPGSDTYQVFKVPKPLLCAFAWFDKALKQGHFQEGETNTIALPEDPTHAFSSFHYYIYHHDVVFPERPTEGRPLEGYLYELCEHWIFGDKYHIGGLQNIATYELCTVLTSYEDMTDETLRLCYECTIPESPLRIIIADYVVNNVENLGVYMGDYEFLGVFEGFINDIWNAKDAFHESKLQEDGESNFPRFIKPYKNSELFEVEVEPAEAMRIPYTSRAVWRGDWPGVTCTHCGDSEAKLFCPGNNAKAYGTACFYGDDDHMMPFCGKCLKDEGWPA